MNPKIELGSLQSERRNANSLHIDTVTTQELCEIINKEDQSVAAAVTPCLSTIAQAIDALATRAKTGGRIIYVGAGTSGRLGVLDASELPPTYSANPQQFISIIAGGDQALRKAQEGAEDDIEAAVADLKAVGIDGSKDAVVGIAASGRTPYVLSCLAHARSIGCLTVAISCCSPSEMSRSGNVNYMIEAVTGAEVVTGSTRMKAGSATKMVLNMLSSGVMIRLGKTYGNMMVDVQATNLKLRQRARNIIREVCGIATPHDDEEIDALLNECGGSVKLAMAVILLDVPVATAAQCLQESSGNLALALKRHGIRNGISETIPSTASAGKHFALCVDGGGSKCAAAIIDDQHNLSIGTSGGCNLSDGNIVEAVANITAAVRNAIEAFPMLKGRSLRQIEFSKALMGLAGFDREPVAELVRTELRQHFQMIAGSQLRLCTDVELVAKIAGGNSNNKTILVLIAGTGSIAMAYRRDDAGVSQIGRRGGWGVLLGDDGSGFDIGRRGIRHALNTLETGSTQTINNSCCTKHDQLAEAIINHFQHSQPILSNHELLMSILRPVSNTDTTTTKKRIADAARVVLSMSTVDSTADSIINTAAAEVAKLAQDMIAASVIEPSRTTLALTGGLMLSDIFKGKVLQKLTEAESHFEQVLHVQRPAHDGAQLII